MPIIEVTQNENRQLQNVANVLASSKRIIMITGAGISTNCGIPDFRSEDGLYALIQSQYNKRSTNGVSQCRKTKERNSQHDRRTSVPTQPRALPTNVNGKDLFDARIWKDPTSISVFYTFIASLRRKIREEVKGTTHTHRFIRTIRDSRKLVRCYTQNIDGLESRLGLCMDLERGKGNRSRFTAKQKSTPRALTSPVSGDVLSGGCEVVPLHGDLDLLRCTLCQKTCAWEEKDREATLLKGKAPECSYCVLLDQQRRDHGKRGTRIGSLRPNIVLYGEEHPATDAVGSITTHDLSLAPDVLLIMGTSLHVQGVKTLVKEFAKCVHARPKAKGKVIFVNLSKPSDSIWKDSIDYWVSMDCDAWIGTLRRHRPDIWHIQTELEAHITKRIAKPPPSKISTSRKGALRASTPEEDKENRSSNSPSSVLSPHRRPSGRPRKQPLTEAGSSPMHRTNTQNHQLAAISDDEPIQIASSSQLPTPPPSGHKYTARKQGGKRSRKNNEEEGREGEQPTTPSKKPRLSTGPSSHEGFISSSPLFERTKNHDSPSKRRGKLEIDIWED